MVFFFEDSLLKIDYECSLSHLKLDQNQMLKGVELPEQFLLTRLVYLLSSLVDLIFMFVSKWLTN